MSNCDRLVSRGEILAAVWHIDSPRVVTRTVDMHISKLRKKLREGSGRPYVLRTVRSEGYMLCSGNSNRNSPRPQQETVASTV